MSEKNYVTEKEGKTLSFNYDYKQVFRHDFNRAKTPAEYIVVKDFIAPKNVPEQQIGLEVLMFLNDFCFASKDQLKRILEMKKLDISLLDQVLDKYVATRIMNFFILAKFDQGEIPEDALRIYCLDHGARSILTHFSKTDFISWLSTDNIRTTELIVKYLVTGRFYLELLKTKGAALRWFKPLYDVNIGKRDIRFSGAFQIMQGFTPRDFIVEVIRGYDLPVTWQGKTDTQIAPFILQKHWEKYYRVEPVYLFIAENDQQAFEIADIFYRRTKSDQFRVITDIQLKKGLKSAVFYKYQPEDDTHQNPELVPVRAQVFLPEVLESEEAL